MSPRKVHADQVDIDTPLVSELVAAQFPQWAALPLEPVDSSGLVNAVYANSDGKAVIYFRDAGKFNERYSNLGFQDMAHLDDGDMWPIMFALNQWTPTVEKKVVQLVKAALS